MDDNEFHDGTLPRLREYSAVFRPYMELVAVVVVQLHRPEKRKLHDLLKNKNIIRKKSGKEIKMFLLNGHFFFTWQWIMMLWYNMQTIWCWTWWF